MDFSTAAPFDFLEAIDAGAPIVVLGGVHIGCYEFFARGHSQHHRAQRQDHRPQCKPVRALDPDGRPGRARSEQGHPLDHAGRFQGAILKAADLGLAEPARVARRIVEAGFSPCYDFALQALSDIQYDRWRDYDPEDTLRFYALRMREAGLIKALPTRIIEENTDWHFFNALKRELKA